MARLVIVDDDFAIHDLLRVFFEDLGHQVRCFETFGEASSYVCSSPAEIDLIIFAWEPET